MTKRLTLKQFSNDEQPREKMLLHGASALSNVELLAIILRSGDGAENALDLSRRILADCANDLNKLALLQVNEIISRYRGVGVAKATAIVSAMELSRRRIGCSPFQSEQIRSSKDAYMALFSSLRDLEHEEFWALLLSKSNRVIAKVKLASGGLDSTLVDVRILLKKCIEYKAVGLIVAHNHPSGNLSPSVQDRVLTRKIKGGCEIMDIVLQDHLIIGGDGYFSFLDEGDL